MSSVSGQRADNHPSGAVWNAKPDELAHHFCEHVMAGVGDAADALAFSLENLTGKDSRSGVEAFFAKVKPVLSSNIRLLLEYVRRTLFAIPDDIDLHSLKQSIRTAKSCNQTSDLDHLDQQIGALRAEIRKCDLEINHLHTLKQSTQQQISVMSGIAKNTDITMSHELPNNMHSLITKIEAAEEEYQSTANLLRTHRHENAPNDQNPLLIAASNALAKQLPNTAIPQLLSFANENSPMSSVDEHEPINHFMPSAMSILQISIGNEADKLNDLSTLRARLLG